MQNGAGEVMAEDPKLLNKHKKSLNAYMKYSGLGVQMALVITVFALGGVKLDEWLDTKPIFIIILSLSGVALSLYIFIKQLITEDKSNKPIE